MNKKYLLFSGLFAALMLFAFPAERASAQCRLCTDAEKQELKDKKTNNGKALHISITTSLDFDRLALTGPSGGAVTLDPDSGNRLVTGELRGLGGMWLSGTAEITGDPGRVVRIDLPSEVILRAPGGGQAELESLQTNLGASPRLDANGRLTFAFGGRLRVDGNAAGDYRGRIRITVNYD